MYQEVRLTRGTEAGRELMWATRSAPPNHFVLATGLQVICTVVRCAVIGSLVCSVRIFFPGGSSFLLLQKKLKTISKPFFLTCAQLWNLEIQNAGSDNLIFKISRRSVRKHSPGGSHLRRSFAHHIVGPHPPACRKCFFLLKNSSKTTALKKETCSFIPLLLHYSRTNKSSQKLNIQ